MKLVGLTGRKGVGKTTIATSLFKVWSGQRMGAQLFGTNLSFARPLRDALVAMGFEKDYLFRHKETQIPGFPEGTTARKLLQTLGTEWGREIIDDNIWVGLMRKKLEHFRNDRKTKDWIFVIDDLRFNNEALLVREFGGTIIELIREEYQSPNDSHISEKGLSPELINKKLICNHRLNGSAEMIAKAIYFTYVFPPTTDRGTGFVIPKEEPLP